MSPKRKSEEDAPDAPAETAAMDASGSESAFQEELERIRSEAADVSDRMLRTVAEFDNYRKRSERERREAQDAGAAAVLRDLLDSVDNFDRAFAHAEESGERVPAAFLEGMRLVARGLHDLLDRRGVKRIAAIGQPFDPHLHEAIASEPTAAHAPQVIVGEVQSGYLHGDRVLRPAKVVVARPPVEESE